MGILLHLNLLPKFKYFRFSLENPERLDAIVKNKNFFEPHVTGKRRLGFLLELNDVLSY